MSLFMLFYTDDFFEDAYKVLVVSNDLENWKKIAKINNLEIVYKKETEV